MNANKGKKKTHILKIKKVPVELKELPVKELVQFDLPEPVVALVQALQEEKVAEIHFSEPEPTMWEKFKAWFE